MARPESKDNADNQMGPRSIGSSGGTSGTTAGVSLTDEDKSGLPEGTGPGSLPDSKPYTNLDNTKTVPIGKSRGTGTQVNNGALTAGQANPAGTGPSVDDDGNGPGGGMPGTGAGKAGMGMGSNASEMAKVTSVSGDKVAGLNYGPSIGRFDNPPAVIKRTGTDDSIEDALSAIEDRWPGTDTEHIRETFVDGTPTGKDRNWR
jgi:hypothetical protein